MAQCQKQTEINYGMFYCILMSPFWHRVGAITNRIMMVDGGSECSRPLQQMIFRIIVLSFASRYSALSKSRRLL